MKDGFPQGQSLKGPRWKLRDLFCPNFGSHTSISGRAVTSLPRFKGKGLRPQLFLCEGVKELRTIFLNYAVSHKIRNGVNVDSKAFEPQF